MSSLRRWLPAALIGAGSWGLAASYGLEAKNWVVMTDELQTARLAVSIADTLSPVPTIHGEYYAALSQLYPLLLAPLYGVLSAPDAFAAAHALNALLWASAAWPAYLLARAVSGSPIAGYLAAAMTAFTPWLVLSATLLTENAAYPAFVWALFLAHRSVSHPGDAADLAALGGVLIAFLARTQLFVLALALPIAVVGHEVGFAVARAQPGSRAEAARGALVRSARAHRMLASAYAVGAVAAGVLALTGSLGRVVGNYAETFTAPLFPPGLGDAAAVHVVHVVVAVGIVPFVLALAWALVTLVRPMRREEHAFALLLLALGALLTFEAASFDLRFTPGAFVQDRYLVYLVPLLAVAGATALVLPRRRGILAALIVAASVGVAWLAGFASFGGGHAIFWAAPAAAFHPALESAADAAGVAPLSLVRAAALALGLALAAAVWRAPAAPTALATGIAVAAFGALQTLYVFEQAAVPATKRPSTIVIPQRDWIDAAVPDEASVALVPNPYLGPGFWWDVEFWNKTVDRVLRIDGAPTFTPFPAEDLSFDFTTGTLRGGDETDLLVVAISETRLHFTEAARLARVPPLRLVRVARPLRADWATRGADVDGWTRPGSPVTVRLYPRTAPEQREVTVTVSTAHEAGAPVEYSLEADGSAVQGTTAPGTFSLVRVSVCVSADAPTDLRLVTRGATSLPDGRVVAAHLDAVASTAAGACT